MPKAIDTDDFIPLCFVHILVTKSQKIMFEIDLFQQEKYHKRLVGSIGPPYPDEGNISPIKSASVISR